MKKTPKSIRRVLIAFIFLVGVTVMQFQMSMVSFAATRTWTGAGGDEKFSTAANWSTGTAPVNGDSITFDVTGLVANETVINDLTGLSLSGITQTGANASGDGYAITGNDLTISGTVESSATKTTGTITVLSLDMGLVLSADTTFSNIQVALGHSIDTQGHNISSSAQDVCTSFSSPLVGSGNLTVSGSGSYGGSLSLVDNPSFTGAITVNSSTIVGPLGMFGSTGNGTTLAGSGSASIYSESNITGTEPLTLGGSGHLAIQWSAPRGCLGDSDDRPQYTDTWTAPITLTSNFLYLGQDHDLTVTGPYTSNGHTWTADVASTGSITVPADPTAPTVPANLVATPSSAQASLTWDAPSSDGGSAITDYIVQYRLSGAGSWSTFADGTSTVASATVTGLTNGSNYDFQVAAVNAIGTGSYDTISNVAVEAAPTVPDAITFPTATVDATSHNVVLNWTAPASNGGSAITDYLIEVKESSASTWNTISHTAFTGTSFEVLTGMTDGHTYDFRISPINAEGTGPATSITNYTYTAGTGVTGDTGNAGGVGTSQTVTPPNTGIAPFRLQVKSPFAIVIFGLASAVAVLFVAWPRRTN